MLNKADCMSILVRLEDRGININPYMKELVVSKDIPLDVLKFISQNQGIEAGNFYEMLRKKHNKSKSPLYTNILNGQSNIDDAITTLSCLMTQIALYSKKLEYKTDFLREVRAEEIAGALHDYFGSGDADRCIALLKLVKSDLLVLEYINGRRELQA